MSGYRLEAKDGSGTFSIPHGETVIGRGAFLGIADKRVSRSHAILEVVDDKLRIKPVHVNPCFYQASDKSTFVPLERNEWCWIQSGDCFSLLPDKYSFQVIAEHHSEEATLRNSEALVEDCTLNDSSPCSPIASGTKTESEERSSSVRDLSKPDSSPPSKRCNTSKNDTFPDDPSSAVSCKDDVETPGTAQRKRVLPNWMLQGDLPVQSIPSPVIKAGKKKKKITETNMSAIKTVQSPVEKNQMSSMKLKDEVLPGTSSGSLLGATELGNSHKRCVIDNEEEMEVDNCDDTPDLSPIQTGGENSPSGSPSTKHHRPSNSKATNNDDLSLSPGSSQSTQQAPMRRPPCMYGAKCYRKNPAHFQEFSHPGDGDYRDVENGSQDDSDDRPECPYGTECYRKNPQHKLEYKHTKPPGRRLRKRATKKGAKSALEDDSDNDGEPNEYDLDDSFLDDDEDEDVTDEDSDWMPDSEEKNSEDMSQLLKEAKKFVKGKR